MNDTLRDIFFKLLQIGLWQKGSLKLKRLLSPKDWADIYSYANIHTVEGIIYDSFKFLEDTQLPPQTLRVQWAIRVDQIERHNAKMNVVIAEQYKAFKALGLSPILQKGQGVSNYYITPNHRICGDIDWYFENDGYREAREYLKTQKIQFNDTAGFSLEYRWNDIQVEHHKQLFDLRSPLKRSYLKSIERKYTHKKQKVSINDTSITILAPELHILQITVHILKHMISFGIGIRQICDIARLYSCYKDQLDRELLKKMYEKAGILKWTHVLHHLLEVNLGLKSEDLPFKFPKETVSDWMLNEIWHGGNFGYYDDRFINGKIIKTISIHPDGAKRMWNNFRRYFPYAPQEALFFPIMKLYSRFIGIDRD